MTLPTSGALSIDNLRTEFSGPTPSSLSNYYAGGAYVPAGTTGTNGAVPASGTISLFNFYGTSAIAGKGYWCGGSTGAVTNEIDGIVFASEAAVNPAAVLATSRVTNMSGVNSSTTGYSGGGQNVAGNTFYNEIDGLTFSTEAATNPAATLVTARGGTAGFNSTTRGYWAGGIAGTNSSEIDGIIFSTEAANNPAATLNAIKYYAAGVGTSTKGYICGGAATSTIDAFTYSTETRVLLAATVVQPAGFNRAKVPSCNSSTIGYFMGGMNTFGGGQNQIDKFIFSSETSGTTLAAVITTTRHGANGVNSNVKGYVGGGYVNPNYSGEIDGIQFSNETAINPAAALSLGRLEASAFQSGGTL